MRYPLLVAPAGIDTTNACPRDGPGRRGARAAAAFVPAGGGGRIRTVEHGEQRRHHQQKRLVVLVPIFLPTSTSEHEQRRRRIKRNTIRVIRWCRIDRVFRYTSTKRFRCARLAG